MTYKQSMEAKKQMEDQKTRNKIIERYGAETAEFFDKQAKVKEESDYKNQLYETELKKESEMFKETRRFATKVLSEPLFQILRRLGSFYSTCLSPDLRGKDHSEIAFKMAQEAVRGYFYPQEDKERKELEMAHIYNTAAAARYEKEKKVPDYWLSDTKK